MAIVGNRYYNDPNLGAAFQNIASMFAPPSGGDLAGYANAKATNQETTQLAELFRRAQDPNTAWGDLDRLAAASGVYAPNQSMTAVDRNNATSITMNTADNQRALGQTGLEQQGALDREMLAPVGAGETRYVPDSIATMYGTAPVQAGIVNAGQGDRVLLPNGNVFEGTPNPMSETEVLGAILQGLPAEDQQRRVLSDINVEQIMGANGPQVVARSDAIGQAPYSAASQPRPTNGTALLPDGSRVAATQGANGVWTNAQTGEPLPAGIEVFNQGTPTGTAAEVGLGVSTTNSIDQQLIDIGIAKQTATTLRDLIQSSPASQGVVGALRGTAQNFIQVGGELGQFFGGQMAEVAAAIESGAADANLAGEFDPNIPAIDMLANLLAFQFAKTTTGERLSNEMLRAAREALGLNGLDANQANSVARINAAISQIEAQERFLMGVRQNGISPASSTAPAAIPSAAPGSAPAASGGAEVWERGPDGVLRPAAAAQPVDLGPLRADGTDPRNGYLALALPPGAL